MPGPEYPTSYELSLKRPLRGGDGDITVLKLREPLALELEQADGDLGLLAKVTGVAAKVLGGLAGSDYAKAAEYLGSWSGPGQLIGQGEGLVDPAAVPESYVLVLNKSLKNGEIAELELAEPSAQQMIDGRQNVNWVTNNLLVMQFLSKVPIGLLRGLCARDFARASEYIAHFTRPGQLTGNGSLPISPGSTAGDRVTDLA